METIIGTCKIWEDNDNMIFSVKPCCKIFAERLLNKEGVRDLFPHKYYDEIINRNGKEINFCEDCGSKIIISSVKERYDISPERFLLHLNGYKSLINLRCCCAKLAVAINKYDIYYDSGRLRMCNSDFNVLHCPFCGSVREDV